MKNQAYLQENRSRQILDYLQQVESNARSYPRHIPTALQSGSGATVTDVDGNVFIDCLAGAGTLAVGHNHPEVIAALKKFLDEGHLLHGLDIATPIKREFVESLLGCFPEQFRRDAKIQFCGPSGADAVEAAVKLFKIHTRRSSVIAFQGAYHGMTNGALSLTGAIGAKAEIGGLMPNVHFFPYPYPYRCPFGVGGDRSFEVSATYLERTLRDPESGITKPAAVIVEPIQGEGGCIVGGIEWLKAVRRITHELDIPLIVDEIQTGFGRTGFMFAFEAADIIPDAVLVSKAVGGGLPLAAVIYRAQYDSWQPGAHAGTFRGNQLAMAAGIVTIDLINRLDLVRESRAKGEYLHDKLEQLRQRFPIIGEVRGRGLMIGMEIVDPTGEPDQLGSYPAAPQLCSLIRQEAFNKGLIVESGGRYNSVLRLLPPLVITRAELDQVVDILAHCFEKIGDSFRPHLI
jgi:diaminobutyrate-2-oxoglutarate transaminase